MFSFYYHGPTVPYVTYWNTMAAALSLSCLAVSSRCRLCKYDTPLAFRAFKRGSKKGESRRRIGEKERAADRRRAASSLTRNCSARFSICSLYDISTGTRSRRKIILHIGTFRRLQPRQPISKKKKKRKKKKEKGKMIFVRRKSNKKSMVNKQPKTRECNISRICNPYV